MPEKTPRPNELAARNLEERRSRLRARSYERVAVGQKIIQLGPGMADGTFDQVDRLLADLVQSLRKGDPDAAATPPVTARTSTDDAAIALFDEFMGIVADSLSGHPRAVESATLAAQRLARTVVEHLRADTFDYIESLITAVHEENLKERATLARELHDHIGNEISIAYRQLELLEIYQDRDPARAAEIILATRNDIKSVLERLQLLLSGLRLTETGQGLEKALQTYVSKASMNNSELLLDFQGNEAWLTEELSEEIFLIIREATRNALRHSGARVISISVEIEPHEVRAEVADDGVGFVPQWHTGSADGLASMRERAETHGGVLNVDSSPRKGTRVELNVPLPSGPDG